MATLLIISGIVSALYLLIGLGMAVLDTLAGYPFEASTIIKWLFRI